MSQARLSPSRASRRRLLKTGLLGGGAVALGLVLLNQRQWRSVDTTPSEALGPLSPVADETTGLELLMLPPGFRYRTLSWAGSRLHDGHPVPGLADGMGVVAHSGSRVTLVRNHELHGSNGPIGLPENAYDINGGGASTLVYDTATGSLLDSWISLGGTIRNCAGGVTPWGSWLSCEEAPFSPKLTHMRPPAKQLLWKIEGAQKEHGFVFEVPATGIARPEPITAMGQFYHEAAAVDPHSGAVFMTEDMSPQAGFYRYLPDTPGRLADGGRLQMMGVKGLPDLSNDVEIGRIMDVAWVDIEHPEQGFKPGNREGDGVVSQGMKAGGSAFVGLEGCAYADGRVYFTSKSGGQAGAGYVFEHDPGTGTLRLIYESPGHGRFSGPDNIIASPRGSLVLCEDRLMLNTRSQRLAGLNADGELFHFAAINPDLDGEYQGHDLQRTARTSEWAGVCYSLDGQWMFANIYNPGFTLAITGPWQDGSV